MAKDLKEEREARTSGEERSRQREQAASVKFESQRQLDTEKDPEGAPGAGGAGRDGERSGELTEAGGTLDSPWDRHLPQGFKQEYDTGPLAAAGKNMLLPGLMGTQVRLL